MENIEGTRCLLLLMSASAAVVIGAAFLLANHWGLL